MQKPSLVHPSISYKPYSVSSLVLVYEDRSESDDEVILTEPLPTHPSGAPANILNPRHAQLRSARPTLSHRIKTQQAPTVATYEEETREGVGGAHDRSPPTTTRFLLGE